MINPIKKLADFLYREFKRNEEKIVFPAIVIFCFLTFLFMLLPVFVIGFTVNEAETAETLTAIVEPLWIIGIFWLNKDLLARNFNLQILKSTISDLLLRNRFVFKMWCKYKLWLEVRELRKDNDKSLELIRTSKHRSHLLFNLTDRQRNDPNYFKAYIEAIEFKMYGNGSSLCQNPDLRYVLSNLGDTLKKDRKFNAYILSLSYDGRILQYIDSELRNEHEYMLACLISKTGNAYTSDEDNWEWFDYIGAELKTSKQFILDLYEFRFFPLEMLNDDLKDDIDIVKKSISRDPYNLHFTSDKYKDNIEFVCDLVSQNRRVINFASERLKALCKDKDPYTALKTYITETSYNNLNSELTNKAKAQKPKRIKI